MFHKIIYSYDSEETDPNFVSFIADDFMDNNKDIDNSVLPDTIPVLPLRNTVIFPGSRLPISVGREKSLRLIKSLGKKQRYIGLVCQKDGDIENPEPDDLYRVGVIAEVMRVIELGNDNLSIIIQAKKRFEWDEMVETEPFFKAKYKIKESVPASKDDKEYVAILDSIRDTMIQMLQLLGEPPKELLQTPVSYTHLYSHRLNIEKLHYPTSFFIDPFEYFGNGRRDTFEIKFEFTRSRFHSCGIQNQGSWMQNNTYIIKTCI